MINSTLEYLYKLHNRGIKLGLANIEKFLIECKNPENSFKSIHIAGTNGKGSTSSILAKILQSQGFNVGLYTSPHLINFNERIRVNGIPISNDEIIRFTKKHRHYIDKNSITFFEATTAMAFDYFSQHKVDYAVIETGLGGRLDSTNVLSPIQTIITEIDFDHTHLLGNSVEEIAAEKCGIIKPNVANTTINTKKNIQEVITKFSLKNRTSTDFINKDDIQITNQKNNRLHFVYKDLPYDIPQSGSYQAQNAILAIETIKKILPNIRADEIQRGLNEWIWPGRMQLMGDNIFYDVAHNSSGIKILSEDLKNIYKKKPFGLVVIKNDKIREEILDLFQNSFHDIVISTIESKEILGKNNIKKIKELNRFKFIENLPEALDNFKHKETSAPKVIFGSHYIAKYVYSFFDFSFDNGSI
tara:strand:- start:73 stop:1317 length:1245 start_codon:yes stop_codon:yes gene_type:complete